VSAIDLLDEDLMVMKLFASRAIGIRDAEGIAVRHDSTFDWRSLHLRKPRKIPRSYGISPEFAASAGIPSRSFIK
jgi:hypothetical protein